MTETGLPANGPRDAFAPRVPEWSPYSQRLRILIVDDEQDIRDSLREALASQFDAEILAVSNGYDAQRLLRSGRCDVVLLDHMMPGIDGGELLTWMRRQRVAARTIVLTALPNEVLSASPLMLRGATVVLRKPPDLPALVAAIRNVLPAGRAEGRP